MPAVFVHGVPDTHRVWDEVLGHLDRTDVVAPDLPGFGAPAPPGFVPTKEGYLDWLVTVVEDVGEPVDLVGHDWGGILVTRLATTRPDLIRTLACGGGPVDEAYAWHDAAQAWQTPELGEQVMELITPETLAPGLVEIGLTPDQARTTAAHVDAEMKRCILALYRSAVDVGGEWAPSLDGFDRPALVLWGADDAYAGLATGRRMAERLGAELVVFDGGHHWWELSHPTEVARQLERLWSRA